MTTNAQAALVAAATINANRQGVTANAVTALADRFMTWLDKQGDALPDRPLTQAEIDAYNAAAAAVPVDERPVNPHLSPEYVAALRRAYPEATDAKLGKVMHPRRCLDADGAHLCKYQEPHRHGFACSKECECNTGDELVREYLRDGDDRVVKAARPASLDEPEQGERETQLDALVIPADTTGPDELHADKRPDSYGDRGERAKAMGRIGPHSIARAEAALDERQASRSPIGFTPTVPTTVFDPIVWSAARLNAERSRLQ